MKSSNKPPDSEDSADDLLLIGKITGAHGLSGAVKVYSYAESADRYAPQSDLTLKDEAGRTSRHKVIWSTPYKSSVRMALSGVATREQAEAVVGCDVFIARRDLPPLEADTHYWADVLGMDVFTTGGDHLGRVAQIIPTGANDVYVVRSQTDAGQTEILVPAIASVVLDIDVERRRMRVELPEGLR